MAAVGLPAPAIAQEKYDVTLNILSHPGQIMPIFTHHTEFLRDTYGNEMNLIESPDPTSYQVSLKDLRSGGGQFDMVMHFPRFNSELVSTGYLMPLDELIAKHELEPLYANIMDTYRTLYSEWGGQT